MLLSTSYKINRTLIIAVIAIAVVSCKKDGNPNNLPSVSTATYEGTIDGYKSSDEVYPDNLIAYWSFDDTKNELKSSTAPTSSANDTYVAAGVRGKALNLNAGYLYYATQFQAFKTAALKSFTISTWVKILNNGSKRTMLFQLARPGMFNGNINFALNTQSFPATTTNTLRIQPTFMTVGGGTQDNLNNNLSPVIGMDKWTHIVLTYETNTGVFDIWADGIKIGGFPNRGVGNNLFNSYEPSEIIIGSNYNGIPGKSVSTDVSFAPMTGQIDEVRIYNRALPDAQIKSLFNLGKANK
ncbi:LamG domain-containing protein [Sediminibacterium goheungense]|uniref:Concanavalin A-like lectin/glucanase superfamily protein n=1 Tax=Sediminibacterium goheungense TaxID=1086393 RepID=A0A4R6INP1_9BACT|nr:LamG domain-containing protein [Sediminibacterium goheungense]TDO23606.1 concanavalin A-like lectin/glucanase superfamily protein [Sediminibacterium goheungense]